MFKSNQLQVESQLNQTIQDMLKEANINIDTKDNLSDSQKHALELFKEGQSLLILGSGGTGKSFLIKTMEEYIKTSCKNKNMYLCSTTGISAYNIGGMTIHSFMGIGTGDLAVDLLIKRVKRRKMYKDRLLKTDILVIDEVSMLSGELFEKLDLICQNIRKNKIFFGGIQIVFTGDFLQLLPVFNKNKEIYKEIDERLIIESPIFSQVFNTNNIIVLKKIFRQKNDTTFINLLMRIRNNTLTSHDIQLLETRQNLSDNAQEHVHLVSSNKKAQIINDTQLNKLKAPKIRYVSSYTSSGKKQDVKELLVKELQFQLNQKGINELILKKGARVMLIKNLDIELGLVNGALGTITDFVKDISTNHDIPIVKFDNSNTKHPISFVSWELEIDGCKGMAHQIPLMLAYSITIHKSQSLTLDSAILDLEDCFCDHQIYVALSRLKTLDGLYLKTFNQSKIKTNDKMISFLEKLK
jgi:ATP-dependent DNA helicase PIF1